MKLSYLYKKVVKFGSACDPRKKSMVKSFEDTAILYGLGDTEVNKILVGIDIDAAELLLADRIRQKEGLDLVISHHPEGKAWANFFEVMRLQVDVLTRLGLKREIAREMLNARMQEVERRVISSNHMRSVDVAKILDMPFMCVHTPADNHVAAFLKKLMAKEKPKVVQDIIDVLMQIPEYQDAATNLSGPRIILGSPRRPVGKILFEMTGGTEGPKEVFNKLQKVGVRTLVGMHLSEEHFKKVKDANLNAVIAGHISSDNLGLNLLLDNIERQAQEEFTIFQCSGFRRIRRT